LFKNKKQKYKSIMKKNTIKVLSALFLSLFLVTACSKDKNTGTTGTTGTTTATGAEASKS
jgi:uncharacterized lipoprotein YajG